MTLDELAFSIMLATRTQNRMYSFLSDFIQHIILKSIHDTMYISSSFLLPIWDICRWWTTRYVRGKNWLHVGSVSFTLTFASHCFCSLKRYCPYIMASLGEPCPSAWILNQSTFVQDPVHLWMATGRKKLTHPLPKTGHSRRYLQD